MRILVLESSTTSAKAMLYDSALGVLDVKTQNYPPEYTDNATQDAEGVFAQTAELGRQMCKGQTIDMISLCGTWHSVFAADENMQPLSRVLSWPFMGASAQAAALRADEQFTRRYYHNTGCMVHAIYPAFKVLYLKEQGIDTASCRFIGQGSYNFYRLTDKWLVSRCMASGSGLLNTHTLEYDEETLKLLGITADQLGKLVDYKHTEPLSAKGAELLGLPEGIPVTTAHSDGGLNQAGAGALKEGVMTFSVGTSAAIRLTTDHPVLPEEPGTWCYYSPAAWLSGAATNGATNCIDWVKNKFFDDSVSYNDITEHEVDLDHLPIFLPFLYGERCPGWKDARLGGFFDVSPEHTPYDFYFAVMQGVLFNVYQCYQVLTELNGIPKTIKLSGGILKSRVWTQMCADIFAHDMECSRVEQTSTVGGAAVALVAGGEIESLEDFPMEADEVVRPNMEMHERYMKTFSRYLDWYRKTL